MEQRPPTKCVHIRWNAAHFRQTFRTGFLEMLDKKLLVDVTLSCGDAKVQCHRLILSACSPVLADLLSENSSPDLIICLVGVKSWQLHALISFMYSGEIRHVSGDQLQELYKVANELGIRGLGVGVAVHDDSLREDDTASASEETDSHSTEPEHFEMEVSPSSSEMGAMPKQREQSQPQMNSPKTDKNEPTASIGSGDKGDAEMKAGKDSSAVKVAETFYPPVGGINGNQDFGAHNSSGSKSGKGLEELKKLSAGDETNSLASDFKETEYNGMTVVTWKSKRKYGHNPVGILDKLSSRSRVNKKGRDSREIGDSTKKLPFGEHQACNEPGTSANGGSSARTRMLQLDPVSKKVDHEAQSIPTPVNLGGAVQPQVGPHPYLQLSTAVLPHHPNPPPLSQMSVLGASAPTFVNQEAAAEYRLRLTYAAYSAIYGLPTNLVAAYYGIPETVLTDFMTSSGFPSLFTAQQNQQAVSSRAEEQEQSNRDMSSK